MYLPTSLPIFPGGRVGGFSFWEGEGRFLLWVIPCHVILSDEMRSDKDFFILSVRLRSLLVFFPVRFVDFVFSCCLDLEFLFESGLVGGAEKKREEQS